MTTPEALYTAARELTTDLLPRLADLIGAKDTVLVSAIGSHAKHPAAPIPWNGPAAMLYHGHARRYESLLTVRIFGRAKYRPRTDDHTRECLASAGGGASSSTRRGRSGSSRRRS